MGRVPRDKNGLYVPFFGLYRRHYQLETSSRTVYGQHVLRFCARKTTTHTRLVPAAGIPAEQRYRELICQTKIKTIDLTKTPQTTI